MLKYYQVCLFQPLKNVKHSYLHILLQYFSNFRALCYYNTTYQILLFCLSLIEFRSTSLFVLTKIQKKTTQRLGSSRILIWEKIFYISGKTTFSSSSSICCTPLSRDSNTQTEFFFVSERLSFTKYSVNRVLFCVEEAFQIQLIAYLKS